MTTNTGWYKIADNLKAISFNEKGTAKVSIQGKNICLIKTSEGLKACTDTCPHAGSSLSQNGYMDNQLNIVCCVHHYRFNLKTGRDALNEGYFLKRYEVKENSDGVFVKM